MKSFWNKYLDTEVSHHHIALFRVTFSLVVLWAICRFYLYDWIDLLYIEPTFHFSFPGFSWIKPFGYWTHSVFLICGFSALGILLGWRLKICSVMLFLSFTYIELMDVTTYLNHYYLVSLLAFFLIWIPNHQEIDINPQDKKSPYFYVWSIRAVLLSVYFFAGLAKINGDWLVHAMPLKMWLPAKIDVPIIGSLMDLSWMPTIFSYAGMLFDLVIPFLLVIARTRYLAIALIFVFHFLTWILFPIGIFPFLMIGSSLIFLSNKDVQSITAYAANLFPVMRHVNNITHRDFTLKWRESIIFLLLLFHFLFPFRYLFYPDELFWTEEGFRFSWRVMLIEKAGYATFTVSDQLSERKEVVQNQEYLTALQEKHMSTQPDLILQYAHYLEQEYVKKGWNDPIITVDSYVALNGRSSKQFIDPTVDLTQLKDSWSHKSWILPFEEKIWGL